MTRSRAIALAGAAGLMALALPAGGQQARSHNCSGENPRSTGILWPIPEEKAGEWLSVAARNCKHRGAQVMRDDNEHLIFVRGHAGQRVEDRSGFEGFRHYAAQVTPIGEGTAHARTELHEFPDGKRRAVLRVWTTPELLPISFTVWGRHFEHSWDMPPVE